MPPGGEPDIPGGGYEGGRRRRGTENPPRYLRRRGFIVSVGPVLVFSNRRSRPGVTPGPSPRGISLFWKEGGRFPFFIAGYICENSSSSSLERKRLVPIRARCARGTETFFLALAQSVSEFHGLFTHGPFRQRISIHQAIAVNGSANRFALNSVKYSYKLGTVS